MQTSPRAAPDNVPAVAPLPSIGFSRWPQIKPFLPMGRETWRKLVRAGKAPQPTYFSKTCAAYRNEEIHKFLADPLGYRADPAEEQAAA